MKAVRLHEYGGPEKLHYEDGVPDPRLQPDSLLIKTVAASINPIDWKVRSGARQKDFPVQFPAILGRDVSGAVSEVGATSRTSNRVTVWWRFPMRRMPNSSRWPRAW